MAEHQVRDRSEIELTTLGGLNLTQRGRRVDLGIKPTLIIVYAASVGFRRINRSELLELLWPDCPPRKARHSLSQALHCIRGKLASMAISAGTDSVQLGGGLVWDYEQALLRLKQKPFPLVLKILSGSFLQNIYVSGGNAFEDWRHALDMRLNAEIATHFGRWVDVARVQEDRRMIAEISAKVQERFDFDLAAAQGETIVAAHINQSVRSCAPSTITADVPFVGRADEIRQLLTGCEKADRGTPTYIAVRGEAGIGKTRLCMSFMNAITRSGAICLSARCYEADRSTGFRPILDALRSPESIAILPEIAEPWKSVIASAVDDEEPAQMPSEDSQNFIVEALIRWLELLSTKATVVLFIDDVQWAGPSTIKFLRQVASGRRGRRLVILIAGRSRTEQELEPDFVRGLDNFATVTLGRITVDDLLVAASHFPILPERLHPVITTLHKSTEGHPYLLSEVLRSMDVSSAVEWSTESVQNAARASVSERIMSRVSQTSRPGRHVLNVISVLARPTSFKIVRRVSGMRMPHFLIALQELLQYDLISDRTGELEAKHDLIREEIYSRLSTSQKQILHKRSALALAERGATPVELVSHYLNAGLRSRAYVSALQSARFSASMGADSERDEFLGLASRLCRSERKRWSILWKRADHAQDRNDCRRMLELCEAIECFSIPLSLRRRAELDRRILDAEFGLGEMPSDELLRKAEELARKTTTRPLLRIHVSALDLIVSLAFVTSNRELLQKTAKRLAGVFETYPNTHAALDALISIGHATLYSGDPPKAAVALEQAVFQARRRNDQYRLARALGSQAMAFAHFGAIREGRAAAEEALALRNELRLFRKRTAVLGNLSTIAIDMGDLDTAEKHLADALTASRSNVADFALASVNCAILCLEKKDYRGAVEHAQNAIEAGLKSTNKLVEVVARAVVGEASLETGKLSEAKIRAQEVIDRDGTYDGNDVSTVEQFLARYYHRIGKTETAIKRLESKLADKDSSMNATCRKSLELELAKLVSRRDPVCALNAAKCVAEWAHDRGALLLYKDAERVVTRLANMTPLISTRFNRQSVQ